MMTTEQLKEQGWVQQADGSLSKPTNATRVSAAPPAQGAPEPAQNQKRIRQSSKGPNKTEQEFAFHIGATAIEWMGSQAIKLNLANGCWYCPDILTLANSKLTAYEVKCATKSGRKAKPLEDDSVVKLKVAAAQYPWIRFVLAWKHDGAWRFQDVFP